MKFDARNYKIWAVPPVNPQETGGMAVLGEDGRLIAYKRNRNNDLKNWDYVRADKKS
jgi:hypothetical protein